MRGQRGWRELAVLGDKINKFTGMIEGLIWSPRSSSDSNDHVDDWAFEEVVSYTIGIKLLLYLATLDLFLQGQLSVSNLIKVMATVKKILSIGIQAFYSSIGIHLIQNSL